MAWEYRFTATVVLMYRQLFPLWRSDMFCISCGFKNPDQAHFCMKCGVALVQRTPVGPGNENPTLQAPKPASIPQPVKTSAGAKATTPPQRSRGSFDFDNTVGAIAVGLGSLLLAFVLVGFGFNALDENTRACTTQATSACYSNGWYSYFLLAFAVAGGGLRMASRIGKK